MLNLRLSVELIVKISLSTILLPVGDLRRVRETRSFRVGGARVRSGLLLLGPEPQVHPAGGRVRHMVGAGNGGLGPLGIAALEGDPGTDAHPRCSPDRGGRGVAQRCPQHLSEEGAPKKLIHRTV
jgi:hypothetical protein